VFLLWLRILFKSVWCMLYVSQIASCSSIWRWVGLQIIFCVGILLESLFSNKQKIQLRWHICDFRDNKIIAYSDTHHSSHTRFTTLQSIIWDLFYVIHLRALKTIYNWKSTKCTNYSISFISVCSTPPTCFGVFTIIREVHSISLYKTLKH
jgi:hypothetical protein